MRRTLRAAGALAALTVSSWACVARAQTGPCDLYAAGGTPCVAAHSTVRALYGAYSGGLYRVRRSSDNTTRDVGVLSAGGYANAAAQDAFCSGTTCVVTIIYDQSGRGNHLEYQGAGSSVGGQDDPAVATRESLTVAGHKVYSLYIQSGNSYWRNGSSTGVPTGAAPEGMYMVTSGTHVNNGCCFDYGNSETDRKADGAGAMDAINFSTSCWFGGCSGTGPWVQADLEYGLFPGGSSSWNPNQRAFTSTYVTAMLKNNGTTTMAIKGANAQSGGLTTLWNGSLPPGYNPMKKQGAIVLGSGGDCCATNRNLSIGTFYEGAMVSGYPPDATENAVQANVVAAGYGQAAGAYTLSVAKAGTGSGTVTSAPPGITCGTTCSGNYASGTGVTLTATPSAGSTFTGWSGACTGTGTCLVTMTQAQSVTATFTASTVGGPISINAGGSASGAFVADVDFSGGSTYSTTSAIDTSLLAGTVPPQAVLQTERYGAFTYTIPGLTAGSPYSVTLYFAESYWTAAGQRLFNVAVNGSTVLSAFDILAAAGGANKAIARTFDTTASSSGQVVIAFSAGSIDNPKVDGITVAAATGTSYRLTVNKAGTGAGTVTGGAINCGATCSASLASGTVVTLTATPASGSTFTGWSAPCTGTGSCTVTMTAAQTVTASFTGSTNPTCTAVSGGQSGNFNTTGASCFTVSGTVNGWGCSNADGRSVTVNGTAVTCGQMPLPGSSPYTFSFTAGTYPWASFYWW